MYAARRTTILADMQAQIDAAMNDRTDLHGEHGGRAYEVRFSIRVRLTDEALTPEAATERYERSTKNYAFVTAIERGALGGLVLPGEEDGGALDASPPGRYLALTQQGTGHSSAHEVGHLLGLDDRYSVPPGGTTERTDSGWEWNLMAGHDARGTDLSPSQIDSLVERSVTAREAGGMVDGVAAGNAPRETTPPAEEPE